MSLQLFIINFNDITKTGLDLSFTVFKKTTDNSAVISPLITELGSGFYKFGFDLSTSGSDIYYVATDGGTNIVTGLIQLNNNNTLSDMLNLVLGLNQQNQAIDETIYDGNLNLLSCRIRTYLDAVDVGTSTNVLATYNMLATYAGNGMQTFQVVLV